jgi:hypothetical protein
MVRLHAGFDNIAAARSWHRVTSKPWSRPFYDSPPNLHWWQPWDAARDMLAAGFSRRQALQKWHNALQSIGQTR